MKRETSDINKFKELYVERIEAISGFCNQYVRNREDAADIAQEAFFKLYERFDPSYTRQNMLAFLYITAKNLCLDYLDHQKFKMQDIDNVKEDLHSDNFFLDEIIREEMFATIHQAVNQLSGRSRDIAILALQNKTNPEIAQELKISINSVKTLKKEMYAKLRAILGDKGFMLLFLHFFKKNITNDSPA